MTTLFEFLRPVYITLHVLWASLWLLVAWHYGIAAYVVWRKQGGVWADLIPELARPFRWAVRDALYGLGWRGNHLPDQDVIQKFDSGQNLRFAIFLGSLTPAFLGLYYVFPMNPNVEFWHVFINYLLILTSILAALIHLFLAFRITPRAWRHTLYLSFLILLLVPLGSVVFSDYLPEPRAATPEELVQWSAPPPPAPPPASTAALLESASTATRKRLGN